MLREQNDLPNDEILAQHNNFLCYGYDLDLRSGIPVVIIMFGEVWQVYSLGPD